MTLVEDFENSKITSFQIEKNITNALENILIGKKYWWQNRGTELVLNECNFNTLTKDQQDAIYDLGFENIEINTNHDQVFYQKGNCVPF